MIKRLTALIIYKFYKIIKFQIQFKEKVVYIYIFSLYIIFSKKAEENVVVVFQCEYVCG